MRFATVALLSSVVLVSGCAGKTATPTAPTPTPVAACVTNNSADVTFENRFSSTTIDVVWDGSKLSLSPLAPGAKSTAITVAAGVTHTLLFRITNSATPACTQSSPVLAQCSNFTYWCPA